MIIFYCSNVPCYWSYPGIEESKIWTNSNCTKTFEECNVTYPEERILSCLCGLLFSRNLQALAAQTGWIEREYKQTSSYKIWGLSQTNKQNWGWMELCNERQKWVAYLWTVASSEKTFTNWIKIGFHLKPSQNNINSSLQWTQENKGNFFLIKVSSWGKRTKLQKNVSCNMNKFEEIFRQLGQGVNNNWQCYQWKTQDTKKWHETSNNNIVRPKGHFFFYFKK